MVEVLMQAKGTDVSSRLQLTTTKKGVIWFDQVSLIPVDTYKVNILVGRGFRNDLCKMLKDLRPGFIRFPGGCFVEGEWLRNAFRWKETIGPWEVRAGHFGDVWHYWTDDGLGSVTLNFYSLPRTWATMELVTMTMLTLLSSYLSYKRFWMELSLRGVVLSQNGVLFEHQWDTLNPSEICCSGE